MPETQYEEPNAESFGGLRFLFPYGLSFAVVGGCGGTFLAIGRTGGKRESVGNDYGRQRRTGSGREGNDHGDARKCQPLRYDERERVLFFPRRAAGRVQGDGRKARLQDRGAKRRRSLREHYSSRGPHVGPGLRQRNDHSGDNSSASPDR